MSAISHIGSSVNVMTNFMKEKVKENIAATCRKNEVTLSDTDLKKILSIIDLSFDQAFSLGFENVEKTLKSYVKDS